MPRLASACRAALLGAACLLGLLGSPGATPAATAAAPPLPPQGVYESCAPAGSPDGCASRLQRIGQAGFKVVVNGSLLNGTSAQQIVAYADTAQAAGLQVIWPLHSVAFSDADPHGRNLLDGNPALSATCGCSDNQGLLAYVIALADSRPNTWGYYLADEPMPAAHASLQSFGDRVKALDPSHPRLVMGCGICYGGDPNGTNISFLSDLDVVIGSDDYPVRGPAQDPERAYEDVAQNARSLQRVTSATGRGGVIALQSWRWGDSAIDAEAAALDPAQTHFPTQPEIQAQRDAAIRYAHPGLILWFTLHDVIGWEPGQRPSYWAEPSDPAQRWSNLVGGAFAPQPNERPVSRFSVRVARRPARVGSRVVVDGGRSYDPDGRIVHYRWTLNGHRLPRCHGLRCSFRARRAGTARIGLAVVDDRAQAATAMRRLLIHRVRNLRHKARRSPPNG